MSVIYVLAPTTLLQRNFITHNQLSNMCNNFIHQRNVLLQNIVIWIKNIRATYKKLVNKIFAELLKRWCNSILLLIECKNENDRVGNLMQAFKVFDKYQIKLNLEKFSFKVRAGNFFEYILMNWRIKVNPDHVKLILNL